MKKLTKQPEKFDLITTDNDGNAIPDSSNVSPVAETSDLENVLASYKSEAVETPQDIPQPKVENPLQQTYDPSLAPPVQWLGNPLYFQTGKKAGQLKPVKGEKPKVNIVPDNGVSTISGDIISGALLLTLVDLLLPFIFVSANNYFTKTKIKVSDLEMSEKQKNQLAPIADRVAHQLKISANPTVLLIFTMISIYGINFAKAKLMAEVKTKPKENDNN